MTKANLAPVPTESQEQTALMEWAAYQTKRRPELALLHHTPNGGARYAATAKRLKAEGVKAGVPDLFLPVAREGFHGLFVELKRRKGGRLSPEQAEWLDALREQGYKAVVCRGFDEARAAIEGYLEGADNA